MIFEDLMRVWTEGFNYMKWAVSFSGRHRERTAEEQHVRLRSVERIVLPAARLRDAIATPLGLGEKQILWNLLRQVERPVRG